MKPLRSICRSFCAFGTFALLCACGGATPSVYTPPFARQSTRALVKRLPAVFVISWWNRQVTGYAKSGGSSIEQLDGLTEPQALAFDSHGRLYVTDSYLTEIAVYEPGATMPFKTIRESAPNEPYGIGIDGAGHIWVANVPSTKGASGNLAEFDLGGRMLQSIVCPGLKDYSEAIAVDHRGDVFIQSYTRRRTVVDEIVAGSTSCRALPISFESAGGLALTARGDLVVGDNSNYDAFTYAAPDFEKIVARTNLGGGNPQGASHPVAIAVSKDATQIWAANYPGIQNKLAATRYLYPHGGARHYAEISVPQGAAIGIAVNY